MTTGPVPADVEFVLELARRAAGRLLERWPGTDDGSAGLVSLEIRKKGRRDLVTAADRDAEAFILDGLQERFPGEPRLAEESGYSEAASSTPDTLWIVDPLDGTTNFAHGHPLFSVSIARTRGGWPDLAVTVAPVTRESYVAWRGGGAYRNGRRLDLRAADVPLSEALLATGFSYARRELDHGALRVWDRLLREAREIRRGGSACLDLAHTAAGIFQGFWEYHLAPHDVAAGVLLVEESGGVITDVEGGSDVIFGGSAVAGAPRLQRELRALVAELGPPHPGHEPA